MSERDELAQIIMSPESFDGGPVSCGPNSVYAARIAEAIRAAGYVLADHTEYALDHKLSDLQFTDDDGELWTDEDDVKDYASEYGDTAPLMKRHVTAWEPAE